MAKAKKERALVPKGPELKLVKPTEKEELLIQLDRFKKNGLTAQEQEDLEHHNEKFAKSFVKLAKDCTGISGKQLLKIKAGRLQVLNLMVAKEAKFFISKTLAWINIPSLALFVIGVANHASVLGQVLGSISLTSFMIGNIAFLVFAFDDMHSNLYFYHRKKIQNLRGRDYFPVKAIKKYTRDYEID